MRESIGTISLLNFIIFFIFLIFAFLMGTFSYYKAYRVNNAIVASIEKYEGFNKYSIVDFNEKLSSLGYERVEFGCPDKDGAVKLDKAYNETTLSDYYYQGYCIYLYENDTTDGNVNDKYDSYEITTVITFQFPIIQDVLKLRVSSRTRRIYDFKASKEAIES